MSPSLYRIAPPRFPMFSLPFNKMWIPSKELTYPSLGTRIHPGNSSLHRGPLGRAAVVRQLLENLSWWQPDHRKNKTPHFNGTGLHRSLSTVDGYNFVGRLGWFSNTGQSFWDILNTAALPRIVSMKNMSLSQLLQKFLATKKPKPKAPYQAVSAALLGPHPALWSS